ncbi:hypothetical protein MLD38_001353 [Melastoma candidum]|uniref:Uncharacterized protein n=1 Tax=Melastoma candidum TaxID=119954 RepID=A0ACB9SDY0_9MYRT|nr:hypothetical protein MLD38_001353 [Melastoma candidum]
MRLRRRLLGVEKRAGGRVDLVGAVNGKVDNEVRVEIGKLALPEELADAVDGVAGGGAGAKANDHPGLDKVDGFEGGDLLEVVLGEDRGVGVAAGMSGLKREEVSFIGGQSMGYRSCRLGIVWSKMQCLQVAAALSRLRGCRETWRCISEPSVTVGAGNALGSKPAGLSGSRGMRMGLRCRAAKIVGFSAGLDVGRQGRLLPGWRGRPLLDLAKEESLLFASGSAAGVDGGVGGTVALAALGSERCCWEFDHEDDESSDFGRWRTRSGDRSLKSARGGPPWDAYSRSWSGASTFVAVTGVLKKCRLLPPPGNPLAEGATISVVCTLVRIGPGTGIATEVFGERGEESKLRANVFLGGNLWGRRAWDGHSSLLIPEKWLVLKETIKWRSSPKGKH